MAIPGEYFRFIELHCNKPRSEYSASTHQYVVILSPQLGPI